MLYANNSLGSMQAPQLPSMLPQSGVLSGFASAGEVPQALPNFAMLQQLASNPLLAYGLCSLLDQMRQRKSAELLANTKFNQML